jgi:hypothetical protein
MKRHNTVADSGYPAAVLKVPKGSAHAYTADLVYLPQV